jgi:hypothetical protein
MKLSLQLLVTCRAPHKQTGMTEVIAVAAGSDCHKSQQKRSCTSKSHAAVETGVRDGSARGSGRGGDTAPCPVTSKLAHAIYKPRHRRARHIVVFACLYATTQLGNFRMVCLPTSSIFSNDQITSNLPHLDSLRLQKCEWYKLAECLKGLLGAGSSPQAPALLVRR